MTAEDFCRWMRRNGFDPATRAGQMAAAPLLAAKQPEVSRWASGKRPVPPRVARIVELLDEIAARRERPP